MDIKPQTPPTCPHRVIAIEFRAGPDDELAYANEATDLPDAFDDEMWVEEGEMVDAYVTVDRWGRRILGEPIQATVGEWDLQDNVLTQKAIDAALAAAAGQEDEPEPEDAEDGPWGHGPWTPATPKLPNVGV
jgi:hypothetical protein